MNKREKIIAWIGTLKQNKLFCLTLALGIAYGILVVISTEVTNVLIVVPCIMLSLTAILLHVFFIGDLLLNYDAYLKLNIKNILIICLTGALGGIITYVLSRYILFLSIIESIVLGILGVGFFVFVIIGALIIFYK